MNHYIYKALNDTGVTDGEMRAYILINELSKNNAGYCYSKNQTLAKILNKHEKTISSTISKLIKKGYLYAININRGSTVIERRLYTENTYKTYIEDFQNSANLIKSRSEKIQEEDGEETTLIINERNKNTGNENTTGTGNENATRTGNENATENIYNINNNNMNISSKDDIEKVYKKWNEIAEETGLSKVRDMTESRNKAINARIQKHGLECVLETMEKIKLSDFLLGNKKSWKADFNFFIKASSFQKIKEDSFTDKEVKGSERSKKTDSVGSDKPYISAYERLKQQRG